MLTAFLFYSSGEHPDLPSFPTRRSSDLAAIARKINSRSMAGICLRGAEIPPPGLAAQADARDRKSTRLNSSHITISYAVFCLKKKRTTTTGRSHSAHAAVLDARHEVAEP